MDLTAFSISDFPNESVGGTKMWKWKLRGYCVFKIIHLHSHTVDSIRAVIFLCLSFPICKMVQVRICSFTTTSSRTSVPLCSPTNFLFWRRKERIVIKTAYEQTSLIRSQWLHSKGWTCAGAQVPCTDILGDGVKVHLPCLISKDPTLWRQIYIIRITITYHTSPRVWIWIKVEEWEMTLVTYDRSKAILLSHNLNFLNM